ncbi:glucose-6-phosphate dehydrogenase [Marinilongibacter aquaticus]|uniref:glucose-6-phosphate dehydrogenase n=1 Tax=Marinilongibacter aquaticus TaxID=2975157 RepID=UPI0021BD7384|nr:glucose-6-phosphate dehydrogenase [Marinilongibacter aquaticus]UBM58354.1 glucose-6-phosphate dehydrogenase [Marinilongibacter aquaticus]
MRKNNTRPTVFVVFGATGDLNWRKINPALYNLYLEKYMPKEFAILGSGRTKYTSDELAEKLKDGIDRFSRKGKAEASEWDAFSQNLYYQPADVTNPEDFKALAATLKEITKEWEQEPTLIFYLAVSADFFAVIAENVGKYISPEFGQKVRIVLEKPFGKDLETANELNALLSQNYDEDQIYRIDHYLGKETVQNILAFRFANSILEPIWNRNYIEHVQISVSEDIGIGNRGGYYDTSGALRDMVQNHIFQLLCLVAMESPVSFHADEIRNRKVDVLKSVKAINVDEETVRAQYLGGEIKGEEILSYIDEKGVDDSSSTETYVALKLFINSWRWHGVPFYIRTGKRLKKKDSTITIQFRDVPHQVFPKEANKLWQKNKLVINIQPEMGIILKMQAKRPGLDMMLQDVNMEFNYEDAFTEQTPEAYETLLLDVLTSDQTLFMRADQVEEAWKLLMPVLDNWAEKKSEGMQTYASGSWGPEKADELLKKDGFEWFND